MKNATIPDYMLERYLLEELPAAEMKEIGELARIDAAVESRLRELRESSAEILREHAPERMVPRIMDTVRGRSGADGASRRRFYSGRIMLPALAAASLAVFFMLYTVAEREPGAPWNPFGSGELTRVKGAGSRIYIYRKTSATAVQLADKNRVHERDLLQIAYFSAADTHGVILSIDGRGSVTLHYPARPSAGTRIEKNRTILLERSYELDDAPGFERFFFVTARKPVDVARVRRAAAELARHPKTVRSAGLSLDSSCAQYSLLLLKD